METHQSFEWGLQDGSYSIAELGGSFGQFGFVVVCDGACKMDGIVRLLVVLDIPDEELREAIRQQMVDGWQVAVACAEGGETGQKSVGQGLSIGLLDDACRCFPGFVKKQLADVRRKLAFQHIANQSFPNVGSAAFVAQNES